MAITHTETITDLIVLNDGTDVVSQVAIKTVSVDDSDPSNLTQTFCDTYKVDTSGGTSAAGFVAYGSLTEDIVKGWIADEPAVSERKARKALAEELINSIKNPPKLPEINKALPWTTN
tara:strand:+ start:588 stop:941 length:354 start_codon:yes stop_codon:yes gene_type:complete